MEKLLDNVISLFVFALGASAGSFLNVVIYRIPAGLSLIKPPSHCPKCSHQLGLTENIPIFGWLWLKGRCHWCQAPISPRYPLIETVTAFIFCLVFWQFGFDWHTISYWLFLSWLLALGMIDFDTMTLPEQLLKSGLVLGVIFHLVAAGQNLQQLPDNFLFSIGGAVLGVWLFEIIRLVGTWIVGQPAMGNGDPKLAAMIGAWLGWKYLLLTGFFACAIGSLVGLLAKIGLRVPFPFGPFLAVSAALSVFWGEQILSTYMKLFI
jgi:leader peptidase (prepilin peptidase)/N-methyltransferase